MGDNIKRFVAGQPYPGAATLNKLVDGINSLAQNGAGGRSDITRGPGGTAVGPPRAIKLWTFKVAQSWSSIDVTSDSPPVKFYTCAVAYLDPTSDQYIAGTPDDIKIYDPGGTGRTLDVDDIVQAFTNPNTGRWEALAGGVSSPASSDCHHIGTEDLLTWPVIAPDDSAYVLGIIDGCKALFPVGDCSTSG